jgi:MFS family permease
MSETNRSRLLWAGFMAILAAGVGFSIRAGILGQWADQYGFTGSDLGLITGGGLTGFGIVILLSSLIADKFGYGRLMALAFIMHVASAILTLYTGQAYETGGKEAAFQCLFWGMFLFAIGNGIAEAVVNPLVAALYPKEKTHYLNILHAGWPGGLVVGGLAAYFMSASTGADGEVLKKAVGWQTQIALFLIPVVIYGVMLFGQKFPKSEAGEQGVSYRDMLRELGMLGVAVICILLGMFFKSDLGWSTAAAGGAAGAIWLLYAMYAGFSVGPWMLAFLLVIHAMVGYVELGTDSWIGKITGAIMASPKKGLLLFVYTSGLMFTLRFFAGPIVHKISPLGLLFVSAVFGALGLTMLGGAQTVVFCVVAATVYALGKTFFWPTMLAVVSERFPKGGAITMGAVGGVGMLSAGLLGGPGIGFKQDYHASANLKTADAAAFERYKAPKENSFLTFVTVGLDGKKAGVLDDNATAAKGDLDKLEKDKDANKNALKRQKELMVWWDGVKEHSKKDKELVGAASLHGGRMALKLTAAVPLVMAICYGLLILFFKAQGGYQAIDISKGEDDAADTADDSGDTGESEPDDSESNDEDSEPEDKEDGAGKKDD